jgi:hypothetical protein
MATRTGTIERRQGRWYAKLSLGDGRRKKVALPRGISETKARDMTAKMAADIEAGVFEPPPPRRGPKPEVAIIRGETTCVWFARFAGHREAKGQTTVIDDRSRFKNHIEPTIGTVLMAKVTRRHIEKIRDRLDREIQVREKAMQALVRRLELLGANVPANDDNNERLPGMAWKQAWNIWCLLTTMFRAAVQSKHSDLRVREDNPTNDVEGPDRGEELGNVHLYPGEFHQLVGCPDVPLYRRLLYTVAAFTGARQGELRALL